MNLHNDISINSPSNGGDLSAKNGEDHLIDIVKIWRMLMRRRWILINTVAFCSILCLVILFQLTPRYTATSKLAVETRQSNVANLEAVISGMGTDSAAIKTEIDVLDSRRLHEKLIDQLGLVNDPEFNSEIREGNSLLTLINPFSYVPQSWKDAILGAPKQISKEEQERIIKSRIVTAVGSRLSISNPTRSYTINLAFESESPRKAAQMANALADIYLTDQLEYKFDATQRASSWLNDRITQLRENVRTSENAVQQFREENQLFQTRNAGLVSDQQLSQINLNLIEARTELARAEARYRQIEAMAQQGDENAILSEVTSSPLIQRLKEQEAIVVRNRAELSTRYGSKHPRMINVEAELVGIRSNIRLEINKIVAALRNEVSIAQTRVSALEENLADLKQENVSANRAFVQLREMEREAESNRLLLESFMSRFKETTNQEDLQQADARIISYADVPLTATFPKKKLILVLVVFASFGLGVAIVLVLEALDNSYRNLEQIRDDTGARGLGQIPFLANKKDELVAPEQYIIDKPTSSFAEAHRNVHAGIAFADSGHFPPQVIQVTSSVPGEGKSTFALCLARMLARSGVKVLLVEADLRRPTLRKRVVAPADYVPFTKCIEDGKPLADAVYQDELSGAMLMAAGQHKDPQKVLKSETFTNFISAARETCDFVIIDTPPVMAVSDVIVTNEVADSTVYAVHWEKTRKEAVRSGIEQLQKTGVKIEGVVITQVNVSRHATYGYGDYGYYYGTYGEYYSN